MQIQFPLQKYGGIDRSGSAICGSYIPGDHTLFAVIINNILIGFGEQVLHFYNLAATERTGVNIRIQILLPIGRFPFLFSTTSYHN